MSHISVSSLGSDKEVLNEKEIQMISRRFHFIWFRVKRQQRCILTQEEESGCKTVSSQHKKITFCKILNAKGRWIKVLKQSHFSPEIVLYPLKIRCERNDTSGRICSPISYKHQGELMRTDYAMIMVNAPVTIPSQKRTYSKIKQMACYAL